MIRRAHQALITMNYLYNEAAKVLRKRPNGWSELYQRAWYASAEARLPKFNIEELFPEISEQRVDLLWPPRPANGSVWLNEMVILIGICRCLQPKVVFEFGTFMGLTTANLAANTPADTVVYTLDIPSDRPRLATVPIEEQLRLGEKAGEIYRAGQFSSKIRQIWSDSAAFDESPFAEKVDLVFVDASHSYDYVKNDTEKALTMLRPRGTVVWHDYQHGWPDVVRYLHERMEQLRIRHISGTSLAVARLGNGET